MSRDLAHTARQEFHRLEWIRNKFFDVVALAVWKVPEADFEIRLLWLQKRSWRKLRGLGDLLEWVLLPTQVISVARLRLGACDPFVDEAAQSGSRVGRVFTVTTNLAALRNGNSRLGATVIRSVARRLGRIDRLSIVFLPGWTEQPFRN